jgi:parallel beta-helix repeat protein
MFHVVAFIALFAAGDLPEVTPVDDLVITESCRLKPGVYRLADTGKPGVIRIEGRHVLVDMTDVTLLGAKEGADPDAYAGTGVIVTGESHVIRRGAVRGYKVGVKVEGGKDHWLLGIDVSLNFAQRLASTPDKEVATDWLWPHKNDAGQWAANYGAGIWIHDATGVRVLDCRGRQQQNGLLLDRATKCLVRQCDFSFNSGWGVALWRSSDNRIERNRMDWCVRGYSHGVYDRGQDSAGILVFEQCHRNRFTDNSATHGGDGFFLYAGHETTKETGAGGCNDNLVERNDFSHAVANGIEATFSTGNRFVDNRLDDCNYGIWAGYSRKSEFRNNVIRGCTYAGVAIEHGSENVIAGNVIADCPKGVWLWWDEDKEFLESVYGKKVRTDSADTAVTGNLITGGKVALYLADSARIRFVGNRVVGLPEDGAVVTKGKCPDLVVEPATGEFTPKVRKWSDPAGARRGRKHILMSEWGPYDFASPMLRPRRIVGRPQAVFQLLGAKLTPGLKKTEGDVKVRLRVGTDAPPEVLVDAKPGAPAVVPFRFVLDVGGKTIEGSGILFRAEWTVAFHHWETDPREDGEAFTKLLAADPVETRKLATLDFPWRGGGPGGKVRKERFATVAETEIDLAAGDYEIVTVSDDGVKVLVDGKVVLENWTHHGPTEDRVTVPLTAGKHRIRIEHFQIDGWSWLSFRMNL